MCSTLPSTSAPADWTSASTPTRRSPATCCTTVAPPKGFVFCSTGSVYGYQGQRPLRESDPPGVPLRANYSFSKIAAEAVCTWVAKQHGIPLTIIRHLLNVRAESNT